jgi:hypothetical protein
MKAFMTPDAPYMSAARPCRTHNRMFIVHLLPVFASARWGEFSSRPEIAAEMTLVPSLQRGCIPNLWVFLGPVASTCAYIQW